MTKEFDEKIAALNDEKRKKLELIDKQQIRNENSLKEIRQRVLLTQQELAGQTDKSFDGMTEDKEKVNIVPHHIFFRCNKFGSEHF